MATEAERELGLAPDWKQRLAQLRHQQSAAARQPLRELETLPPVRAAAPVPAASASSRQPRANPTLQARVNAFWASQSEMRSRIAAAELSWRRNIVDQRSRSAAAIGMHRSPSRAASAAQNSARLGLLTAEERERARIAGACRAWYDVFYVRIAASLTTQLAGCLERASQRFAVLQRDEQRQRTDVIQADERLQRSRIEAACRATAAALLPLMAKARPAASTATATLAGRVEAALLFRSLCNEEAAARQAVVTAEASFARYLHSLRVSHPPAPPRDRSAARSAVQLEQTNLFQNESIERASIADAEHAWREALGREATQEQHRLRASRRAIVALLRCVEEQEEHERTSAETVAFRWTAWAIDNSRRTAAHVASAGVPPRSTVTSPSKQKQQLRTVITAERLVDALSQLQAEEHATRKLILSHVSRWRDWFDDSVSVVRRQVLSATARSAASLISHRQAEAQRLTDLLSAEAANRDRLATVEMQWRQGWLPTTIGAVSHLEPVALRPSSRAPSSAAAVADCAQHHLLTPKRLRDDARGPLLAEETSRRESIRCAESAWRTLTFDRWNTAATVLRSRHR